MCDRWYSFKIKEQEFCISPVTSRLYDDNALNLPQEDFGYFLYSYPQAVIYTTFIDDDKAIEFATKVNAKLDYVLADGDEP
jgi:hypothetical protein